MGEPVFILAARRTAIGRFNGGLADIPATALGAAAIRRAIADAGVDPAGIDEVIMGHVLTAGAGQNTARQSAIGAGLPINVPAFTVNKVCGSGLKAVHLGAQAIAGGDAALIVAGGQESMSRAPHLMHLRRPTKYGDAPAIDSIAIDGLVDAFHHIPMGVTGDRLARNHGVTREMQDQFSLASHSRAIAAQKAGAFDAEIVPVTVTMGRETRIIDRDEQPRAETSLEALGRLKPAFGADGTVTAGNAASLNDGAAALVLASAARMKAMGAVPLARIVSWASAALDPLDMGMGAGAAASAALRKAGWRSFDPDLIELNEAFAAQALAVIGELGWDRDRVNVNGGAVALGHPIGASGARVLVTLLHAMQRRNVRRGLATLCIGGGQGVAICVERD